MGSLRALLTGLALFTLCACGGEIDAEIEGPTILLVAGARIPDSETPAQEGLYAAYSIETQSARTFSRRDLASLRWRQITTEFPAGGRERVFEGPLLSLVLEEAGLDGPVRLTAFDGFEAVVQPDMIARFDPILALRADGAPLATGGLGPLMLVWPRGERGALADMSDDLWPWGVFAISPAAPLE